eukprot:751470-Hanusia_phi.AAC.5
MAKAGHAAVTSLDQSILNGRSLFVDLPPKPHLPSSSIYVRPDQGRRRKMDSNTGDEDLENLKVSENQVDHYCRMSFHTEWLTPCDSEAPLARQESLSLGGWLTRDRVRQVTADCRMREDENRSKTREQEQKRQRVYASMEMRKGEEGRRREGVEEGA